MPKKVSMVNVAVGFLSQAVILILGLIVPRIILVNYGSDVNGLTNTITQLFIYMALLELGISQATKNALYKPIFEKNKESISKCLTLSRKYYRRVSVYYFAVVLAMAFVMPFVMKTRIDFISMFFYILFEGITSVVSFYFINTWTCYLNVSGKTYIVNLFTLLGKVLGYLVKISLAVMAINIIYIQVGYFLISLVQLLLYKRYMNKHYIWIDYNMDVEGEYLPDKKSYFISEIAWTIFSSTDMIVLSIFVSTSLSSVYSVYNMVFVSLTGLLNSVYGAISYKLGQTYTKDVMEYRKVHDCYNTFFVSLIVVLMSVCYLLILPFVKLYTSGVNDTEYIYSALPFLFCIIQILSWTRTIPANITGVAGYAKQVSRISIIEAIMNITLSIILVKQFGIVGVLIATVASVPIKVIYCNYLAEKTIMRRSCKNMVVMIISNYMIFFCTVIVGSKIEFIIDNFLQFFFWGICLLSVYVLLSIIINYLFNRDAVLSLKSFLIK